MKNYKYDDVIGFEKAERKKKADEIQNFPHAKVKNK